MEKKKEKANRVKIKSILNRHMGNTKIYSNRRRRRDINKKKSLFKRRSSISLLKKIKKERRLINIKKIEIKRLKPAFHLIIYSAVP